MSEAAVINFHGIGTPPPGLPQGEEKYWISPDSFRAFLDTCCVGQARTITFDDGNLSDIEHGAPELEKRGLRGAFFVCADRIGQPGYMSAAQLSDLVARGHVVGSHGRQHVFWPDLEEKALIDEVAAAAEEIAEASGAPVNEVAIPFGRYDRRVLAALRQAGFERVYSSDGQVRLSRSGVIPRYSVRSDLPLEEQYSWFLRPAGRWSRLRQELKLRFKAVR